MSSINLRDGDVQAMQTSDGRPARLLGTRLADSQYRFVVAVTEVPDPAEEPVEVVYYACASGNLIPPGNRKDRPRLVAAGDADTALPKVYDAACPHCGEVQEVKLKGLFATPEKGIKAVICKNGCKLQFVVAWKDGVFETRRER